MLVVEKTRHIKATLSGQGADTLAEVLRECFPDAAFFDEDAESVDWENSDLALDIKAKKTPGKLVRAYRERSGMTLVELARTVGTKYPNLSAIENDSRVIGLSMARKLGEALGVDYRKFLD
jgi:DNA-binding XRE family transcriptional regulator